uniref:Uncharacterized protein n=1 Tax=Poecilia mexicana TaxID=48701 RepID=A0A3B3Z5U9_9TELE
MRNWFSPTRRRQKVTRKTFSITRTHDCFLTTETSWHWFRFFTINWEPEGSINAQPGW